jgi:hypothetical protein
MRKVIALAGQAVTFAMFALLVGWFSASPSYTHVDPANAVIRLSFDHAAARVSECRPLTPEEIAELAPNMRRSLDCPRGRVPLLVELELDGTLLYRAVVPASGLAGDGPATVYQRFVVPPGPHEVTARLRDSRRTEGFDYESSERVDLAASRNFVIDFRSETGGFIFK